MTDDILLNCLAKAEESLAVAKVCLEQSRLDSAANRLYYALYHGMEAVLLSRGVDPSSQRHLQSSVYHHLVQPGVIPAGWHKLLVKAYEDRITGDYSRVSQVSEESIRQAISQAEDVLPQLARLATGTA